MNTLLALMLAYALVSTGSVVLAMRPGAGHLIGLMSLLYAFIALGLLVFLIDLIQAAARL